MFQIPKSLIKLTFHCIYQSHQMEVCVNLKIFRIAHPINYSKCSRWRAEDKEHHLWIEKLIFFTRKSSRIQISDSILCNRTLHLFLHWLIVIFDACIMCHTSILFFNGWLFFQFVCLHNNNNLRIQNNHLLLRANFHFRFNTFRDS